MSEPKFTPGPWTLGGAGTDGSLVIFADGHGLVAEVPEAGNARLIAAAPDLYAAMVELSDLCPRMNDDDPIGPAIRDAVMRGRAALRKADGR